MGISRGQYRVLKRMTEAGMLLVRRFDVYTLQRPEGGLQEDIHHFTGNSLIVAGYVEVTEAGEQDERKIRKNYTVSSDGKMALIMTPTEPAFKLTKPQIEVLHSAMTRGKRDVPDRVSDYGVNSRTLDILDEEGYIEMRPLYDAEEMNRQTKELVKKARELLIESEENWGAALLGLQAAGEAQARIKEKDYFVTEKAKRELHFVPTEA